MANSGLWRLTALMLATIVLSACGAGSLGKDATFSATEDKGMVVIGFLPSYSPGGGAGQMVFGRYDPATLKVTGAVYWGKGLERVDSDGILLSNKFRNERFRAYKLPPGEYALAHLAQEDSPGMLSLQITFMIDIETKKVRDNTPVFTVKAGEVLYLGDFAVDYRNFPARLTIRADLPRMAEFIKTMPGVTVNTVSVRPIRSYGLTPKE